MVLADLDGRSPRVNARFCDLLGYERDGPARRRRARDLIRSGFAAKARSRGSGARPLTERRRVCKTTFLHC
jgi:hypothetical protein